MEAKQEIELPRYVRVDYYDDYMRISKRWRGMSTIFLTLFLVIWLYVTILIAVEVFGEGRTTVLMAVLLLFFVVACSIFYSTAANWVNRTNVFVSQNAIEIKRAPMPWPGNKRVEINEIEQFYVKTRITGSRDKRQVNYELHFIEKNKNDVMLLTGFGSKPGLLFVEQEIEKYLGIVDVKLLQEDVAND